MTNISNLPANMPVIKIQRTGFPASAVKPFDKPVDDIAFENSKTDRDKSNPPMRETRKLPTNKRMIYRMM